MHHLRGIYVILYIVIATERKARRELVRKIPHLVRIGIRIVRLFVYHFACHPRCCRLALLFKLFGLYQGGVLIYQVLPTGIYELQAQNDNWLVDW